MNRKLMNIITCAAYARGVDDAKEAASWTFDGNSDPAERGRVLARLRNGDPEAYDYLPREPNLSGEFADDLTPLSLTRELVSWSGQEITDDLIDQVADAYEEGVHDTFIDACEIELERIVDSGK